MVNDNCLEYQILLNEKVDNEIKGADEVKLFSHLKNCTDCSRYYADLKSMKLSFSGIEKITVSNNFEEKLLNKIKASKTFDINSEKNFDTNKKIRKSSIFTKFVSYAAGVAIVAFAFIALEKSNILNEGDSHLVIPFNSSTNDTKIMATTIDSSESKFVNTDIKQSTLDSLEKLKSKPYIDINDLKHRVSNEGK